jgi:hypothetical protein
VSASKADADGISRGGIAIHTLGPRIGASFVVANQPLRLIPDDEKRKLLRQFLFISFPRIQVPPATMIRSSFFGAVPIGRQPSLILQIL